MAALTVRGISLPNFVPQGHEKAMKTAFYNAAAMAFVVVFCFGAAGVFFILQAFLRPLLWASLCGTFLYPFKYKLVTLVRGWMNGLKQSQTPLTVGVLALPFQLVLSLSELIGNSVSKWYKAVVAVALGLPLVYFLYTFFTPVYYVAATVFWMLYEALGLFSSMWIWTVVIAYLLVVLFLWNDISRPILEVLAIPVWFLLVLHLATVAGPFRVPIFILCVVLVCLGFVNEKKEEGGGHGFREATRSIIKLQRALSGLRCYKRPATTADSDQTDAADAEDASDQDDANSDLEPNEEPVPPTHADIGSVPSTESLPESQASSSRRQGAPRHLRLKKKRRAKLSSQYFLGLLMAILLVNVWNHLGLVLKLLPVFILVWLLKVMANQVGLWNSVKEKWQACGSTACDWLNGRDQVLFPPAVRGLGHLLHRGDNKIIHFLENSIESLISVFIILLLIFGSFLASIVLTIQIQQESMHLIQISSSFVNNTLYNQPALREWLPEGFNKTVDSMMSNAYLYGREWIASQMKNLLSGQSSVNKSEIETQVLQLWDKLYNEYTIMNDTGKKKEGEGVSASDVTIIPWYNLWENLKNLDLDLGGMVNIVQDNVDTLKSVTESVWLVLKGNVNLVLTLLTTTISMVLGGGSAVLNFAISMIIFLTTLFYLLSYSREQYIPIQWLTSLSPIGDTSSSSKLGQAVEEAIRGVFEASLKMGTFYGLYTWLTHTVFNMNMVYFPSVLAALFGAVPFVGTYWAASLGVTELLIQGQGVKAAMLAICSFLPSNFVDTAIYSDISGGGHPYMTGLAIAGGVYWLGLEGAIIGPILLCCLLVAVNVYSTVMRETPITTPTRPPEWILKRAESGH